MDEFLTLGGTGEAETRVRGSRFHALASPVETEAEARAVLDERERQQFDATHHCAAWRFRDGSWRALDAGEPSGSAGAPILTAIDADSLVDVAVVVTRYFGGTKLGVGGLVRAYGEAAAAAISTAPKRRGIRAGCARIAYPYDLTSIVMRAVDRFGSVVQHGYDQTGGEAAVDFAVPLRSIDDLRELLREQSAGSLHLEINGETVLYSRL